MNSKHEGVTMEIEKGKIITATPFLEDPFFKKTVVLLADFNENGTLGFIMNKVTNLKLADLLEGIEFDADIFYGGPVGNESVYYLHTLGNQLEDSLEILPGLFWGGEFDSLKSLLNAGIADESQVRFFAGYSGWDAGQLEKEFETKSWILGNTKTSEVMNMEPNEEIWRLKVKADSEYAIWSNFTDHPHLN